MKSNVVGTALVNYICPICGGIAEEVIVLNEKLTEKAAQEVNDMHGKSVGFSDVACKKCASHKDDVVYCISVDPDKSDFKSLGSIYRNGPVVGVKKEAPFLKRLEKFILTLKDGTKYCFIEGVAGKEIGLWN